MVHISHTERIQLGCGFIAEFQYDCTVDRENKDFPVTAKNTSAIVLQYGKRVGTWEEYPRFWAASKDHDWAGFENRVIETANASQANSVKAKAWHEHAKLGRVKIVGAISQGVATVHQVYKDSVSMLFFERNDRNLPCGFSREEIRQFEALLFTSHYKNKKAA